MTRIAAYCRVSTDKDEQTGSLKNQQKFFHGYISNHPEWILYKIYVDEGISGTNTNKRYAFNQMINDAKFHRFDMIITKEISRFARNTLDSIYYTRKLKEFNVGVIFMDDAINTMDPDAELRLTILSSIAQEESRKTSQRVKWGQKRKMEQGVVFGRNMLGYDLKDGKLYINQSGAKIVKMIFHKFVSEGKSSYQISKELENAGIKTSRGSSHWSSSSILKILRNEKYCGNLVQKKTFTPNYLSHKKVINKGQEDFIIIKNHHEPIIDISLFEKAQTELKRRSLPKAPKSKYSNKYCFSGKIICGNCGHNYVARSRNANNKKYTYWKCYESLKSGTHNTLKNQPHIRCSNITIKNTLLEEMLQGILQNINFDRSALIDKIYNVILLSFTNNEFKNIEKEIKQLEHESEQLLDLYLENIICKDTYKNRIDLINKKIENLKSENNRLENIDDTTGKLSSIYNTILSLLNGELWENIFYRTLIDRIIIQKNHDIDIYLKYSNIIWKYVAKK